MSDDYSTDCGSASDTPVDSSSDTADASCDSGGDACDTSYDGCDTADDGSADLPETSEIDDTESNLCELDTKVDDNETATEEVGDVDNDANNCDVDSDITPELADDQLEDVKPDSEETTEIEPQETASESSKEATIDGIDKTESHDAYADTTASDNDTTIDGNSEDVSHSVSDQEQAEGLDGDDTTDLQEENSDTGDTQEIPNKAETANNVEGTTETATESLDDDGSDGLSEETTSPKDYSQEKNSDASDEEALSDNNEESEVSDVATAGNDRTYSDDDLGNAARERDEAYENLNNYRRDNDLGMSMKPSPEEQELIDKHNQANSNYENLKHAEELRDAKVSDMQGWLKEINPNFDEFDITSPYCNNCGSCAYAVNQRLEGNHNACADANNIGYNSQMEALTGMKQIPMSPQMINDRLLASGNDSHAIIGVDRANGPGHWFNAVNINGRVYAIDGQDGSVNEWPPDYGNVANWEMSVKEK